MKLVRYGANATVSGVLGWLALMLVFEAHYRATAYWEHWRRNLQRKTAQQYHRGTQ